MYAFIWNACTPYGLSSSLLQLSNPSVQSGSFQFRFVVALVIRDQMFTNSLALQADLLVEETEIKIVKDGFTGLHIPNCQTYFWRIFFTPLPFQVKKLALSTAMVKNGPSQ
jgi:hypothetical protein